MSEQACESREVFDRLVNVMRDADREFESGKTGGGGTRHYLRDCLLPRLEAEGLLVVAADQGSEYEKEDQRMRTAR